jgi:hypothetical protein
MKQVFTISVDIEDDSDNSTQKVEHTMSISTAEEREIVLIKLVSNIYSFLEAIGYTNKETYEVMMGIGHVQIEDQLDNATEEDHEAVFSSSLLEEEEETEEEGSSENAVLLSAFEKFIQGLTEGTDDHKREALKKFMEDLIKNQNKGSEDA